jgi:hypothetical protein
MDVLETKDRRVCFECVEDEFLRAEIKKDGRDGTCFYCGRDVKTFSIDQMADLVGTALSQLYYRTDTNPPDHAADRHRKGQPVADVINDAGMGYVATEDILHVLAEQHDAMDQGEASLEEDPFAEKACYAKKESLNAWDFEGDWLDFETSLKKETRYFNRTAEAILTSIFEGIEGHNTTTGRPIVVDVGPGMGIPALYRARVFQAKAKLKEAMKRPDQHVGPPPPSLAVAGRMNAGGISVFYGATDPEVALAEVRPPVGSRVLIGRFEVIQPLRLLDLQALEFVADEEGSIFDQAYIGRLRRAKFLRGLSWLVSKPVMPDDQPREYLPTQAIADFLAIAANPPLDGMIYPSVQVGYRRHSRPRQILGGSRDRRNVVLFHKPARVQPLDIPEGAKISILEDDGSLYGVLSPELFGDCDGIAGFPDDEPEVTYSVFEDVGVDHANLEAASTATSPELDDNASLKFSTLEVRFVRGTTFDTLSSPVPRYRAEKQEQARPAGA